MIRKIVHLIILYLFLVPTAYSQPQDTILVTDNHYLRRNTGMHLGLAYINYYYGTKMSDWLGNYGGGVISLQLNIKNHHFGGKFKPATFNPKGNLMFNNDTLVQEAKFNVIHTQLFYGYDYFLTPNLSIQPQIAFLTTTFLVINEDEINRNYGKAKVRGLTVGIEPRYIFHLHNFMELGPYFSLNYSFVKYDKVNSRLENNFFTWEAGLKFGGWFSKLVKADQKE